METTIQLSRELLEKLKMMKMNEKETYENIIWNLIEDRLEFSEQTKRNIQSSEKDIRQGKTISLANLKKKVGA